MLMRKLLDGIAIAALTLATAAAPACGDDEKSGDAADDTGSDASDAADGAIPDLTGKSAYHIAITMDDGEVYDLGLRDLTESVGKYAFGSSHIAPAVSFAMTDGVTSPRTINVTLDFGIVVPSEDHPIATDGAGDYPFSELNPSMTVFVKQLQYRSINAGAAGSIIVSDWSTETGGIVAGTFHGTLVADGPTGKTVTVDGYYHFILPEKEQGQPQ